MVLALKRCRFSDRRSCLSVMLTWLLIMSWCTWHPENVSVAQEPDQPEKASILITDSELASAMKEPNLRILDARSQHEYAKGHLAGAMRVDVNDWKTLATADRGLRDRKGWSEKVGRLGISRHSQVVVYGDRLSDTARIWWLLKYVGVENAAILDGGWRRWVKQGRPAEKSVPKVAATALLPGCHHRDRRQRPGPRPPGSNRRNRRTGRQAGPHVQSLSHSPAGGAGAQAV